MTDATVDPQTPQPGLEPGPARKMRVAAVGDLHVGETSERLIATCSSGCRTTPTSCACAAT